MIVCVCRRVTERDIERAAHQGCGSLEDLQIDLGLGLSCGRCAECAREVLARCGGEAIASLAPIARAPRPACACA